MANETIMSGVSYCHISNHDEFLEDSDRYESIVEDPKELYIGGINLLFTLVGSSTNLLIIIFLLRNKNIKDVPTLLFVVLCTTDFINCTVLGTFQNLISFRAIKLTSVVNKSFFFFKVISMMYNVVMRFSLFQFTLMSVSRCMLVRSPFRVLNRHAVSASLVGYLFLCVVMFVLPFWLCDDPHLAYKATLIFRIGSVDVADQVSFRAGTVDLKSGILIFTYELISTCLPLIPTLVSCILTGLELLRRKGGASQEETPYIKEKRAGAVTVILLTSSTVLCFLPRTVLILSFLFQEVTLGDIIMNRFQEEGWRIMYLLTTGLAIANSCVNPLIFIVRSRNIRWYWRDVLRGIIKGNEVPNTFACPNTVLTNIMSEGKVKAKTRPTSATTYC
ncbi:galanin receptor 2b-like [Bolinopsis microptera]|uniref:galanin receptor 2b-like n=1 Tax=Bolinopsis microptera TaxID=2820187 RepID=UPI00307ADAE9